MVSVKSKSVFIAAIFIVLGFVYSKTALAATYYMATDGVDSAGRGTSSLPWHTFAYSFGQMSGGDTLIVKDGVYADALRNPPNGSVANYTIVKAQHDGGAIIDASARDGWTTSLDFHGGQSYIQIEGFKFKGGSADGTGKSAGVVLASNHLKILRCAFFDPSTRSTAEDGGSTNYHTFSMDGSSYVLIEDSWAWGYGRYRFESHESDHIIFRRVVGRYDRMNARYPMAVFAIYSSAYNEFQNCIAIDSDQDAYYTGESGFYGGLISPNTYVGGGWSNRDMKVLGSIALNVSGSGVGSAITHGPGHLVKDTVVWDSSSGISYSIPTGADYGPITYLSLDHVTVGDINGHHDAGDDPDGVGAMSWAGGLNTSITNSIFYDNDAFGVCYFLGLDYNIFFANGGDYGNLWCSGGDDPSGLGVHDRVVDPALRYILRTEAGSTADGSASDGGDVGATILKRTGVSGTLWGEAGYNSLTAENLWPWPNQDRIRSDMRTYIGPPSGIRGFAANNMSLTKYIWEYLGNPMPAEYAVCGNAARETGEECDDGNTAAGDGCDALCRVEAAIPVCGNGIVEAGEACDDGNVSNTDACLTTCVAAGCGDGYTHSGVESCDDGNASNADGCLTSCIAARCGDGYVYAGSEECDDGNASNTDACLASCRDARCGDGYLWATVEACDDGNTAVGDGCDGSCRIEPPPPAAVCGDGVVEGVEECDDGNATAGDGCDALCGREIPVCGNGIIEGLEECDDGATVPGDGCDDTCHAEAPPPLPICGNGVVEGDEECDDGNMIAGDGCDAACRGEISDEQPAEDEEPAAGNEQGESPDTQTPSESGSNDSGSGDSGADDEAGLGSEFAAAGGGCSLVSGVANENLNFAFFSFSFAAITFLCFRMGSKKIAVTLALAALISACGGKSVAPNDETAACDPASSCDDSNTGGDDSENGPDENVSEPEVNQDVGGGEIAPASGDGLRGTDGGGDISGAECGNGILETGEICDDGNTISDDGCDSACRVETPPPPAVCGDGVSEGEEECDDGNTASGDGCDGACRVETLPPAPPPAIQDDFGPDESLWSRQTNSPGSIAFGFAEASAEDNLAVKIVLAGDPARGPAFRDGPVNANQIALNEAHLFGTYRAKVKAASCAAGEEVVTGVFVYSNDGVSDTNGNGLIDNNEIDIEIACSIPNVIWLTTWTDYDESSLPERFRKVTRRVDMTTGNVRQTAHGMEGSWGGYVDLGSPIAELPIAGFSADSDFYEMGFEWRSGSIRFFIVTGGSEITLWNYSNSLYIPQNPAAFMFNVWHDSSSWADGSLADYPSADSILEVDWFKFWE